jgi:hypothetical protein
MEIPASGSFRRKVWLFHMPARSKPDASLPQLVWRNANFGVSPILGRWRLFRRRASIPEASPVNRRLSQQSTAKQIQQFELRDS